MTDIDLNQITKELTTGVNELLAQSSLKKHALFVLGCSTSEICGATIGKGSNLAIGEAIVDTLLKILTPLEIDLAVQGCEHINRALAMPRESAERHGLNIVSVVPALHAGGACSVAAFKQFTDPVEVEHIVADIGMDIGDTGIGMHIKFVQIPVRTSIKQIGNAHVTYMRSRPKLIGGPRAEYVWNPK